MVEDAQRPGDFFLQGITEIIWLMQWVPPLLKSWIRP